MSLSRMFAKKDDEFYGEWDVKFLGGGSVKGKIDTLSAPFYGDSRNVHSVKMKLADGSIREIREDEVENAVPCPKA